MWLLPPSDMEAAFQALTDHRESAAGGNFSTYIETIENIRSNYSGVDDAERMRNFIIDMYNNYGDAVRVAGAVTAMAPHGSQLISTRGCLAGPIFTQDGAITDSYIPADLYFGCLDGSWNNDGDNFWGESNDGIGGGDIDWYSEVYVGRIPADNASEATEQINKIIAYETGAPPFHTLPGGAES